MLAQLLPIQVCLARENSTDTIEGRFGHFIQLSGENYFISMRQLYKSDRKLRAFSFLKYSKISLTR